MSHTTQIPEPKYALEGKRIWVAGHRGMVGSALLRRLQQESCTILTAPRKELDLTRQSEVENWLLSNKPDAIIIAAARVGGIHANNIYPAEFIYQNLMIEANIIHAAHIANVEKLLFLGSSCIYPKFANQPIAENELLTAELEPTNEPYAIAKIAGIKLCQAYRKQYNCDFISAMPTNLYGPGDNFNLETSHVIPALIRKAHEARQANEKSIKIWGSGTPRREFMHVDDLADALIFLTKYYSESQHINVGSGKDISILELATLINQTIGFTGEIILDTTKPDGTPKKLMLNDKLGKLGWKPNISLEEGLGHTYNWFTENL